MLIFYFKKIAREGRAVKEEKVEQRHHTLCAVAHPLVYWKHTDLASQRPVFNPQHDGSMCCGQSGCSSATDVKSKFKLKTIAYSLVNLKK